MIKDSGIWYIYQYVKTSPKQALEVTLGSFLSDVFG